MLGDYYDDQRYCATCDAYVFYLLSPATAYCSYCGDRVSLFPAADLVRFREAFAARRGPGRHGTRESGGEYQDAS